MHIYTVVFCDGSKFNLMQCVTPVSCLRSDICFNCFREGNDIDVILSVVSRDNGVSTGGRFCNLMDKRVDKSSDGKSNYAPMYLCCECEDYLKKGDSDSASYWAGMLWKILLPEHVLKVEEFAEMVWFFMPL